MITIIDYSAGNLYNVVSALRKLSYTAVIANSPNDIENADLILLPGVGSFDTAMQNLKKKGMDKILKEKILSGCPLLGICLGLQLLFPSSEEGKAGERGLDIIPGKVKRLPSRVKVPHMGWNKVLYRKNEPSRIFSDIPDNTYFYFAHSYYAEPQAEELVKATTEYAFPLAAAIKYENIWGLQFHPEKSGSVGLKILANFIKSHSKEA